MIKDKILELLRENGGMRPGELFQKLEVNRNLKKEVKKTLSEMEKDGLIFRNKKGKYRIVDGEHQVVGPLQGHDKGFGFVLTEEGDDVYVDKSNLHSAMHGDTVLVKILEKSSPDRRREGEVKRVLKRGKTSLVGTYQGQKDFGFVLPDDDKFSKDIYIDKKNHRGAKDGQKVVVKIIKWPNGKKNPEGVIEEILGYPGDKGVDVLSIAKSIGFRMKFPKKVLREAAKVPQSVSSKEIKGRTDYRNLTTFTIDGADSKDFDDAVSIEKKGNGNYLLGVHIADVAHYVKQGSNLDKEAFERGNSVYLLDEVLPMLPVELSNGICSLNEGVDRLTMSVMMEIDHNGSLIRHQIEESVIRSSRRLIYTHVSDFLEDGKVHPSIKGLEEDLTLMGQLAKILREKRDRRGSIDFDLPERHIELDEQGKPVSVSLAERRTANRLIEEFMLMANETVAEQYYWMDVPFLYRIHEEPDEAKLKELNLIMRPFGHKLRHTDNVKPMEIKQLLKSIEGQKEFSLIEMLVLRSLKKAKYSSRMEGHFGLASDYYTHFTSPIRRYNDLTIHRIIKEIIHNKLTPRVRRSWEDRLPNIAEHISETEKLAQEGERAVEDVKMAQYMADKIGNRYEGIISGITGFGIFVQLKNTVEGLIAYKDIDDYVEFDEDKYEAKFRNSKKVYTLGQKVEIEVAGVNIERGQIDFIPAGDKK